MTVVIKKLGGSMAIVIPRGIVREMDLAEGMSLEMTTIDGSLVVRKPASRPRRSLERIVAQIKPANYRRRRLELGDDQPVGRESR